MVAIGAMGLGRARQGGIIRNGRRDSVQNIAHFLFHFVAIDKWLIRSGFRVTTESASVLENLVSLVFL